MCGRCGIRACALLLLLLAVRFAPAQQAGQPGRQVIPRPEGAAPLDPDGSQTGRDFPKNAEAWTPEHFRQAVRRRHGRLPDVLVARSRSDDAAEFTALVRELLDLAAQTREAPSASDTAGNRPGKQDRRPPFSGKGLGIGLAPGQNAAPGLAGPVRPPAGEKKDGATGIGLRGGIGGLRPSGIGAPGGTSPGNRAGASASSEKDDGPGDGDLNDDDLVRACVQSLLINDSDPAWQTLEAILTGMQTTPLNQSENARAVIEELFSRPSLNPLMAESLLIAVVEAGRPAADSLNVLTALSEHVNRATFGLLNSNGEPDETRQSPQQKTVGQPLVLGRGPGLLLRSRTGRKDAGSGPAKRPAEKTTPPPTAPRVHRRRPRVYHSRLAPSPAAGLRRTESRTE